MAFGLPSRARVPVLVAIAAALAIAAPGGSAAAPAPGCPSFDSQAAAQEYLGQLDGGAARPVGRLDGDGDGIACEGLPGPFEGFATIGYNVKKRFFYGTVSMPPGGSEGEFPCLYGNRHFADGPRLLTVYRVAPGADVAILDEVGAEARPGSGRLLWKAERAAIAPGSYYAAFEERVPLSPYGRNECPGFRSLEVRLPQAGA